MCCWWERKSGWDGAAWARGDVHEEANLQLGLTGVKVAQGRAENRGRGGSG